MEETKKSYGTVRVAGENHTAPKDIKIADFITCDFADRRSISVSHLEDDTYVLAVENPMSTGRHPQSLMRLSRESFIGLITSSMFYLSAKGEDIKEILQEAVQNNQINYSYSDNLNNPFPKDATPEV